MNACQVCYGPTLREANEKNVIQVPVIMTEIFKKSRPDLYTVKYQCKTGIIGEISFMGILQDLFIKAEVECWEILPILNCHEIAG